MSNSHFQAYFHGLCCGVGLIKLLPCQLLPFSTLRELRNRLQDCNFFGLLRNWKKFSCIHFPRYQKILDGLLLGFCTAHMMLVKVQNNCVVLMFWKNTSMYRESSPYADFITAIFITAIFQNFKEKFCLCGLGTIFFITANFGLFGVQKFL
jgi:hypothetical protein